MSVKSRLAQLERMRTIRVAMVLEDKLDAAELDDEELEMLSSDERIDLYMRCRFPVHKLRDADLERIRDEMSREMRDALDRLLDAMTEEEHEMLHSVCIKEDDIAVLLEPPFVLSADTCAALKAAMDVARNYHPEWYGDSASDALSADSM